MMRGLVVALLLPLSFLSACKKGPEWKAHTFEEKAVKPQTAELEIPARLWEKVVGLLKAAPTDEKAQAPESPGHGEGYDEATPETALEPLKVFLIERNKGVLKGQNIALSFVQGGGVIDLGDYVQPLRGSYYVAFEFMPDVAGADPKVFFLSNSVVRKVGNDRLGSGCNAYFDLTKRVDDVMKHDGFLVNTSDQRDVSALVGTYVFASALGGKLHMATLVVKDDAHRALQCRR